MNEPLKSVVMLADFHKKTWSTKDSGYWFQRLVQEVGELGSSLAGDHKHSLNYASLEASKRLHEAGIVLETEKVWAQFGDEWILCRKQPSLPRGVTVPAPSMAEVWRELPNGRITIYKCEGISVQHEMIGSPCVSNNNPTDALIDLLIWAVRNERKEEI